MRRCCREKHFEIIFAWRHHHGEIKPVRNRYFDKEIGGAYVDKAVTPNRDCEATANIVLYVAC